MPDISRLNNIKYIPKMSQSVDNSILSRREGRSSDFILLFSFYLSGCCALIYQTGWQRLLYGVIGVDMDSITVIVSVFMLGIGVGGMLGGWLADQYPHRRILWYCFAEFSIAIYGASSLYLLETLEISLSALSIDNNFMSVVVCVTFLIIPTASMGMTLPLLAMTFNERKIGIGVSVGKLYFANTLGAATGAGVVPFVLLPLLALDNVIVFAVVGNIVVAACALLAISRYRPIKEGE